MGTVVQTFVVLSGLDPITPVYLDICPQGLGYDVVRAETGDPTIPYEVRTEPCYHSQGSGNVVFLIDLDGVSHSFTCPIWSESGVQSYRVPVGWQAGAAIQRSSRGCYQGSCLSRGGLHTPAMCFRMERWLHRLRDFGRRAAPTTNACLHCLLSGRFLRS